MKVIFVLIFSVLLSLPSDLYSKSRYRSSSSSSSRSSYSSSSSSRSRSSSSWGWSSRSKPTTTKPRYSSSSYKKPVAKVTPKPKYSSSSSTQKPKYSSSSLTNKPAATSSKPLKFSSSGLPKAKPKYSSSSSKVTPSFQNKKKVSNFQAKMNSKYSKKQSKQAMANFKAKQSKYTKKPVYTSSSYSNSSLLKSTRNRGYDRNTRYVRRQSYYRDYDPPTYIYNTSPSFGAWDAMFMWMMLDSLNDKSHYQTYYHHQNDPGMQQWRNEANRLAKDNAELKAKLDSLDQKIGTMNKKGVKKDPNYLPKDVDPDVLLSEGAIDSIQPRFTLCTGNVKGNYYATGQILSQRSTEVAIDVKATSGSVHNTGLMSSGQCDGAIIQSDVLVTDESLEVVLVMYPEYSHLLCSKRSGIDSVRSLNDDHTISIGPRSSGSAFTWRNFGKMDSRYKKVNVEHLSSQESLLKLVNGQIDCFFTMISNGSDLIKQAEKYNLVYADVGDWDFNDMKDKRGRRIYEFQELDKGFFGTDSVIVRATLVTTKKWKAANPQAFDGLALTLLENKTAIDKLFK